MYVYRYIDSGYCFKEKILFFLLFRTVIWLLDLSFRYPDQRYLTLKYLAYFLNIWLYIRATWFKITLNLYKFPQLCNTSSHFAYLTDWLISLLFCGKNIRCYFFQEMTHLLKIYRRYCSPLPPPPASCFISINI